MTQPRIAERPAHPLGVLGNRAFLLLWLGLLISSAGDWVNYVAMVAIVFGQTHSALALAALRLFHIVPILLVAPFAGVFVDRWNLKYTLMISPLIAGVSVAVLAVFHPVILVFLGYGAITVALSFFNPARSAVIPALVPAEDLLSANSFSQITSTASIVVGGLAGGVIVSQIGATGAFVFDAVSFAGIAVMVALIHLPHVTVETETSFRDELSEGIGYLRRVPVVGTVVIAGGIFVFAPATVLTLGYAFVQNTLHSGAVGYGQVLAGLGVGSALGAIVMILYRARIREDISFAVSGILLGLGVALMGLSHGVRPAAAGYGIAGFGSMVNTVAAVTLLQRMVPERVRGRIFAVSSMFDHVGAFASTLGVGAGTGLLDAAGLITGSGVVAGLTGLVSLYFLRRRG